MIKRSDPGRITFHCDTPGCAATTEHETRSFRRAQQNARRKGWAIGTDLDACPAHHV